MADEAGPATVVVLQRFVRNSGDGWSYTLAHLEALLDDNRTAVVDGDHPSTAVTGISGPFLREIRRLGEVTAGLHLALSSQTEPEAFCPEPITSRDVERWQTTMAQLLAEVCRELCALPSGQRSAVGLSADEVARLEAACRDRFDDLRLLARRPTAKIRHHGDYHLGQVLKTDDGFAVIDFEGEPARPLEERRAKVCPLKDVGGMLRSFNYAAAQVLLKRREPTAATDAGVTSAWEAATRAAFLEGYRSTAEPGRAVFLPAAWDEAVRVIQVYELDKALYELRYELRNRPDWLSIPLTGLRALVGG
jgi:maltose alpha-D-glucosyltransferase/alpha-amylase